MSQYRQYLRWVFGTLSDAILIEFSVGAVLSNVTLRDVAAGDIRPIIVPRTVNEVDSIGDRSLRVVGVGCILRSPSNSTVRSRIDNLRSISSSIFNRVTTRHKYHCWCSKDFGIISCKAEGYFVANFCVSCRPRSAAISEPSIVRCDTHATDCGCSLIECNVAGVAAGDSGSMSSPQGRQSLCCSRHVPLGHHWRLYTWHANYLIQGLYR